MLYRTPTHISSKAKDFIKKLVILLKTDGVVSNLDKTALDLIAQTYHNYLQATEIINDEGLTLREPNSRGQDVTKMHPAAIFQKDAISKLFDMLKEFGLTPKAREKMTIGQSEEESPLSNLLKGGKEVRVN